MKTMVHICVLGITLLSTGCISSGKNRLMTPSVRSFKAKPFNTEAMWRLLEEFPDREVEFLTDHMNFYEKNPALRHFSITSIDRYAVLAMRRPKIVTFFSQYLNHRDQRVRLFAAAVLIQARRKMTDCRIAMLSLHVDKQWYPGIKPKNLYNVITFVVQHMLIADISPKQVIPKMKLLAELESLHGYSHPHFGTALSESSSSYSAYMEAVTLKWIEERKFELARVYAIGLLRIGEIPQRVKQRLKDLVLRSERPSDALWALETSTDLLMEVKLPRERFQWIYANTKAVPIAGAGLYRADKNRTLAIEFAKASMPNLLDGNGISVLVEDIPEFGVLVPGLLAELSHPEARHRTNAVRALMSCPSQLDRHTEHIVKAFKAETQPELKNLYCRLVGAMGPCASGLSPILSGELQDAHGERRAYLLFSLSRVSGDKQSRLTYTKQLFDLCKKNREFPWSWYLFSCREEFIPHFEPVLLNEVVSRQHSAGTVIDTLMETGHLSATAVSSFKKLLRPDHYGGRPSVLLIGSLNYYRENAKLFSDDLENVRPALKTSIVYVQLKRWLSRQ